MQTIIHVNMPLRMPHLLELFLDRKINPEVGIDAWALDSFSREEFQAMAARLHAAGLQTTLHGPFIDLSPGSPDAAILAATRARLQQLVDVIEIFKPRSVVCHAGYEKMRYGWVYEQWLEKATETWSWMNAAVADAGSRLVLENTYEHGPEELVELFEAVPDVGFCLDVGHTAAFGKAPLQRWIDVLGGRIAHLHLHDNHGQADDHLALGQGSLELDPLWDFLRRRDQLPVVTIEPHQQDQLKPSLRYLEQLNLF